MSDFTVVYGRLTSKSTFSPSGIFGALMLGMNLWKEEEYMLTKILHFTDFNVEKTHHLLLFGLWLIWNEKQQCDVYEEDIFLKKSMMRYSPVTSSWTDRHKHEFWNV